MLVRVECGNAPGHLVPGPPVAARLLANTHVEPDWGVEARLLCEHQVRQFVTKVLRILLGLKIPSGGAPTGDRVNDAVHELLKAALPIGPTDRTVEVLASHDIRCRLRPTGRHLHIALLEYRIALGIGDHGCPPFPFHDAVRRLAWPQPPCEIAFECKSPPLRSHCSGAYSFDLVSLSRLDSIFGLDANLTHGSLLLYTLPVNLI